MYITTLASHLSLLRLGTRLTTFLKVVLSSALTAEPRIASLSPSPATYWLHGNLYRISHEILYMVFLLFPLIQERQFLVISESICTLDHFVLVNCLEGLSLSARLSGLGRSFNCIPGIHRPPISQSDLLVYARDSRNSKPILAPAAYPFMPGGRQRNLKSRGTFFGNDIRNRALLSWGSLFFGNGQLFSMHR